MVNGRCSQPASLLDVNSAAEEEAWLAAREAVLMQARRRHAAAILLQRRLPLLLARLRAVREVRLLCRPGHAGLPCACSVSLRT